MPDFDVANLRATLTAGVENFRAGISSIRGDMDSLDSSVAKNKESLKALGVVAGATFAAIATGFKLTTSQAITMNADMANVASLIPGQLEKVKDYKAELQDMAGVVAKTTGDLAAGMYQTISAFGDSADMVEILETNAKIATAGLATTAETLGLTSAVTKAFGDETAEAVKHVGDLSILTVRLGQTTLPELAGSIGRVSPLASTLGVSLEELFGVMATGAGVTGTANEVSTQFRGILQALMAPTEGMSKLYEKIGVSSGQALLKQKGLAETLQIIVAEATASNQPLQDYIGSIEGQTLALALAGSQYDNLKSKIGELRNSSGALTAAFDEQSKGINKAGFEAEQARQKFNVMGQVIGDTLMDGVTSLTQVMSPMIEHITEWVRANPELTKTIIGVTAAVSGGTVAIVAMAFAVKTFNLAIVTTMTVLAGPAGMAIVIAGIVAGVMVLTSEVTKASKAIDDLNKSAKDTKRLEQITATGGSAMLAQVKAERALLRKQMSEGQIDKTYFDSRMKLLAEREKAGKTAQGADKKIADVKLTGEWLNVSTKIKNLEGIKALTIAQQKELSKLRSDLSKMEQSNPWLREKGQGPDAPAITATTFEAAMKRFDTMKLKNDPKVSSLQEQADWLKNSVLPAATTVEEKTQTLNTIFALMSKRFTEFNTLNDVSAKDALARLDKWVGAYAITTDQQMQLEELRVQTSKRAMEDEVKAKAALQDKNYANALAQFDKESAGNQQTAVQELALFNKLVVDKLSASQRSADAQRAIEVQLARLKAKVSDEDVAKTRKATSDKLVAQLEYIEKTAKAQAAVSGKGFGAYNQAANSLSALLAGGLQGMDLGTEAQKAEVIKTITDKVTEYRAQAWIDSSQDILESIDQERNAEVKSVAYYITKLSELTALEERFAAVKQGLGADGLVVEEVFAKARVDITKGMADAEYDIIKAEQDKEEKLTQDRIRREAQFIEKSLGTIGRQLKDIGGVWGPVGDFLSSLRVDMEALGEEGISLEAIFTNWKEALTDISMDGLAKAVSAIGSLIGGGYKVGGSAAGSPASVGLEQMKADFASWEDSRKELEALQAQQARATVGGAAVGAIIGLAIPVIGPMIGAGLGALIGDAIGKSSSEQVEALKEKLDHTFESIKEYLGTTTQSLQGALSSAFDADTYDDYITGFGDSMSSTLRNALTTAFMESQAMKPLLDTLSDTVTQAVLDGQLTDTEAQSIAQQQAIILAAGEDFRNQLKQYGLLDVGKTDTPSTKKSNAVQVSQITGETRDLLVTYLSPLGNLPNFVTYLGDILGQIRDIMGSVRDRLNPYLDGMVAVGGAGNHIDTVNIYPTITDKSTWDTMMTEVQESAKLLTKQLGKK